MSDQLAKLRETFGIDARLRMAEKKYNPDQPRVPKGEPIGGEWTDDQRWTGEADDGKPGKPKGKPDDKIEFARAELKSRNFADFGTDESGAAAWGKKVTQWKKGLTTDEKKAIKGYTEWEYQPINKTLRGIEPKSPLDDKKTQKMQDQIAVIDEALKDAAIPEDVVTYRSLSADLVDDLKIGEVYTDPGFMSTTIWHADDVQMSVRGTPARLVIAAPAGTNAAYLDGASKYPDEHEILFPRNTQLLVVDRYEAKGMMHIKVVPVPRRQS